MGDWGGKGGGFWLRGWEGVGDVKGTHAQTRLSLGTGVAYSPLFNC